MDIQVIKNNDITILRPAGRLDTKTSHEFEKKIIELLTAGERRFLIDFAEIDYISSAGLRVLLMSAKKLTGLDGDLLLSTMNRQVREVFDVAGFSSIFTIAGTQSEALAIFAKKKSTLSVHANRIAELAASILGGASKERPRRSSGIDPDDSARIRKEAARLLGIIPPVPVEEKPVQAAPAAAAPSAPAAPAPEPEQPKSGFGKWFRR